MGKYIPGSGPYEIRYGLLKPEQIPDSFIMADWVYKKNERDFHFYTKLEESILKEGFRNPVMVYEKPGERTFPYGGTRVWIAQKLDIPVPAIISDWTGIFKDWELITTINQALSKFKDLPTVMEFHPQMGCQFWGCEQVQLEDKDKEFFKFRQFKNNQSHLMTRMKDGQYFYADINEKASL